MSLPDLLELLADMLPDPDILLELLLAIQLEPPPQFASTSIPRNVFVSILSVWVLLLCDVLLCDVLLCDVPLCDVPLCDVLRSELLPDCGCVWRAWFWSWLLDELEVEL